MRGRLQPREMHVGPERRAVEDENGFEQPIAQQQAALAALQFERALDERAVEPGAAHPTAFRKLRSMS